MSLTAPEGSLYGVVGANTSLHPVSVKNHEFQDNFSLHEHAQYLQTKQQNPERTQVSSFPATEQQGTANQHRAIVFLTVAHLHCQALSLIGILDRSKSMHS